MLVCFVFSNAFSNVLRVEINETRIGCVQYNIVFEREQITKIFFVIVCAGRFGINQNQFLKNKISNKTHKWIGLKIRFSTNENLSWKVSIESKRIIRVFGIHLELRKCCNRLKIINIFCSHQLRKKTLNKFKRKQTHMIEC